MGTSPFEELVPHHRGVVSCTPTPLYRYDKAASAFKLDRRSAGVDAPRWVALDVESEEKCLERNGWNFLTPEEPATWGAPPTLDAAEYAVAPGDASAIRDAVLDHGVALVKDMVSKDVLDACAAVVTARWDACKAALGAKTPPLLFNGIDRFEYAEVVRHQSGPGPMLLPSSSRGRPTPQKSSHTVIVSPSSVRRCTGPTAATT